MRSAALCLLITASAVAEERKPKFTYKSNESGFTVGLPGPPKTSSQNLTTVAGTLPVHTARYDSGSDLVLSVTTTNYPKDFATLKPEKLFDGILDAMRGADGKVTEKAEVTIGADKHPGREWRIEAGKQVIRVRVYLVGSRLYQVMANGSKDGVSGSVAEDLFRTFDLMK
jgi:hypothetical protein